jgi:hypothetical protein
LLFSLSLTADEDGVLTSLKGGNNIFVLIDEFAAIVDDNALPSPDPLLLPDDTLALLDARCAIITVVLWGTTAPVTLLLSALFFGAAHDDECNFKDGSFNLMPFLAAVVVGDRSMDDDDDDDTAACCRLFIDAFERCIVAVISRHLLVLCLLRPFHFKSPAAT